MLRVELESQREQLKRHRATMIHSRQSMVKLFEEREELKAQLGKYQNEIEALRNATNSKENNSKYCDFGD